MTWLASLIKDPDNGDWIVSILTPARVHVFRWPGRRDQAKAAAFRHLGTIGRA